MVKKIQVLVVKEYVYEPDPEDYVDELEGEFTIERALELDKADVPKGKIKLEDLAEEITVVGLTWRIIDEPDDLVDEALKSTVEEP